MGFTALIPAAGRGERLDRKDTPKPLVEVGGQAIIARTIGHLKNAGVERFVIVTGYRGEHLQRSVRSHPALNDLRIEFIHNDEWEKGLASSLLKARDAIQDPFVLAMGDHLFESELVSDIVSATPPPGGLVMLADRNVAEVHELDSAVKLRCEGDMVHEVGRELLS